MVDSALPTLHADRGQGRAPHRLAGGRLARPPSGAHRDEYVLLPIFVAKRWASLTLGARPSLAVLTDDTGLRFESNMTVVRPARPSSPLIYLALTSSRPPRPLPARPRPPSSLPFDFDLRTFATPPRLAAPPDSPPPHPQNQHKAFNMLLNSRVEEAAQPAYASARVRYAHTRELDTFHDVPAHQGQPRRKVRVTRDQKDKTKVHAVEKVRVADMNVFSPKRRFDWRVSVSLEMPGASSLASSLSTLSSSRRAARELTLPARLVLCFTFANLQLPSPTRRRPTLDTRTASRTRTSCSRSTSPRSRRPRRRSPRRRTSSRSSSRRRGRSSRRRQRSSAARTTGTSRWCRACSTTFVRRPLSI